MLALLPPLPVTNDRPVVWLSVSKPWVTASVSCTGAVPASTSAMTGALAPTSVSGLSSTTLCATGKLTLGGSLTASTVTMKVVVTMLPPSVTDSVIVTGPPFALLLALAAGVRVTVRLAPEPPITILPFGTSAVLPDVAVTIRPPAAVSASETEKAWGPIAVSSLTDWLATPPTVGV